MAEAPPEEFARGIASLREVSVRPEVVLEELPPPGRLAPYAVAMSGRVIADGDEVAVGRFVVLHDPAGQRGWEGRSRVVAYVQADVDEEMGLDPLLPQVGWSWLLDALDAHGAQYAAAAGTVTRTSSARFGDLAGRADSSDLELRASWSPLGENLGAHALAFCDLLCSVAGLPPAGVSALGPRRAPG